ncbi:hypothetical protein MMC22_006075 [Lobaria immixta]|nr:hypothetical protein [Lobaria immixta]
MCGRDQVDGARGMSDEQGGAGGDVGEQGVHEQDRQVIFEVSPVGRTSHGRPDGIGAFDDGVDGRGQVFSEAETDALAYHEELRTSSTKDESLIVNCFALEAGRGIKSPECEVLINDGLGACHKPMTTPRDATIASKRPTKHN